MRPLFRFLLLLTVQKFWGEVTIRFKDGEIAGQVDVRRGYVVDTLPQPVPGTEHATQVAEMEQGTVPLPRRVNI